MGHTIQRYTTPEREYFLIWSSVVDAPVTLGMTRDELAEYVRGWWGESSMSALPGRIARAERTGTSSRVYESLDDEIACNRAGVDETHLTRDQIVMMYCLRTGNIRGREWNEADE